MSLMPHGSGATVVVVGPAYLDEVVEVEGGLFDAAWLERAAPGASTPLRADYSLTERSRAPLDDPGTFLLLESPGGDRVRVTDPGAVTGRRIVTAEDRLAHGAALGRVGGRAPAVDTRVGLLGVRHLLGGMGAGFALALGGHLVLPLGDDEDARRLGGLLKSAGIPYNALRVPGTRTDTTILLSSTAGDKLPVGRRAASRRANGEALLRLTPSADIAVVTSLPNATAAVVAGGVGGWTLFTPSLRNARQEGFESVARAVDALALNATEWAALGDREAIRSACPLVLVTRGTEGVTVHCRDPDGAPGAVDVPVPLVRTQAADTNRAGEAFAAGFVGALVDAVGVDGLKRGRYDQEVLGEAARQGCLAAYLELDIKELAFPSRKDVLALRRRA